MKTVTDSSLAGALNRAISRVQRSKEILSTEVDAGMIVNRGKPGHRVGLQVFVRVCRYSDEMLKAEPMTGGLLERRVTEF